MIPKDTQPKDTQKVPEPLPLVGLGETGLEVSRIGLGTVKLGRNEGVKYPSAFSLPDDATVRTLLDAAHDLNINLIDTAPAYGTSEQRLGQLLKRRKDWVICSKVGEDFHAGRSRFNFSAAHANASIERSLRRLRTDYLDIVLIHSDGNDRLILQQSGCLEALKKCQERGLIRAIGMSTKTPAGALLAVEHCDVVMLSYNPTATDDEQAISRAHQKQRGVLIKKGLDSGHACSTGEVDPVLTNMRFIFRQPGVHSIIIGSINPAHVRHNAAAAIKALGERKSTRGEAGC